VVLLAALLVACGSPSVRPTTITVSAAASLTGTFTELARQFEAGHPDVQVRLNLGPSTELAQQIVTGAGADVFASADTASMDTVSRAGLLDGAPSVFATNKLQIAVPPGNPKAITSFAALANPGLTVVVASPQEPCGLATVAVQSATGVALHPASEEPDVKSVLAKLTDGDADAALVFLTDIRATHGKAQAVDFPAASTAVISYPIAAISRSPHPEPAREFLAMVSGPAGRQTFAEAGFGPP
jgi:molybdate transport system substrate-binding protein